MATTRFVPNPAFRRELESERPFVTGMSAITVHVKESIKTAAEPFRDTGNFIERVGIRSGHPTQIELERHFAHIMELGSVNNPPQRNVLRGTVAAGLRFEDTGAHQAD